jgi:hypothetical protein
MVHASIDCVFFTMHITQSKVICIPSLLPNNSSLITPQLNGNLNIPSAKTYMTDAEIDNEFDFIVKHFSA